jgi:hypothetical protein
MILLMRLEVACLLFTGHITEITASAVTQQKAADKMISYWSSHILWLCVPCCLFGSCSAGHWSMLFCLLSSLLCFKMSYNESFILGNLYTFRISYNHAWDMLIFPSVRIRVNAKLALEPWTIDMTMVGAPCPPILSQLWTSSVFSAVQFTFGWS